MYIDEKSRKEDEKRLYNQLMYGPGEFCKKLNWLSDKALASTAPDRFQQMFRMYLSVMTRFGGELFGGDVYWNTDSELIEPTLNKILVEGYDKKIEQLMLGAHNLLGQVKTPNYYSHMSKLHNIAMQYYSTTRRYLDGGVLSTDDRMIKWDYIDAANNLFGAAYDIVQAESRPIRSVSPKEKEEQEKFQKALEEKFNELFGELDHPVRYRIKKFFCKIFTKPAKKSQ